MIKESLELIEKNGITYLHLPHWAQSGIVGHGFSSRLGGVSSGPFASLNLGYKGGDRPEAVHENRRRFLEIWGKGEEQLFYGEQVHGIEVIVVDKEAITNWKKELPAADAFVTAEHQLILGAFSADCLLAFFFDRELPAIGLAHAGWRGTCAGILGQVVDAMSTTFGSRPGSLEVLLAPAIGPCCYEVGREVVDFCADSPWMNDIVFLPGNKKGHPFLDLQATNYNILCSKGVKPHHIFGNNYCTHCNQHLFYSYRGAKRGVTGSQMGIIFIR